MTNFFVWVYRYFRCHRLVCWLTMVLMFVFFGWQASLIHLEEDIDKLMPSSRNEDGTTKLAFANLKIKDKVFLLFAKGSERLPNAGQSQHADCAELMAVCDAFVDSLQQDSALIEDIFYQLDEDIMLSGIDYLTEHLPAYIDTAAYARFGALLTKEHFRQQMRQNHADLMGEPGELFAEQIQMDPMGMRNVLAELSNLPEQMSASNYQTLDGHFFVPDSTVCLAFLTPHFSSTNTGQGAALFERLNTLIRHFAASHPQVAISYHGTPASGYYNSTQIKHDLTTTIAGALALVLVFLLLCFRRLTTLPLLLLPIAFGTLFGLTMMYWLKGQFSLLALGIGGVVLGVAMSYVLHVLTHHVYVGDGEQLLRDQTKPVCLGCLTTIGSFAGLIFIQTDLLRDFGLFAAFAILGTTLFSLSFLPQLLESRACHEKRTFPSLIDRINACAFDRSPLLIAVILLATVVCVGAYLKQGTRFDADMHNLGYLEEMTERSEQLLREKTMVRSNRSSTDDKQKYFASKGKTMEEALEHFAILDRKLDSLQRLGLVKSYTRTNQIFVPLSVQRQRIDAWKHYWTAERLSTVRRLVRETAPQAGLNADAFDTFFQAVSRDFAPAPLYEAGIIPTGYLSTLMEQSYDGHFLCFTSVRCQNDSVRSAASDYIRICDAVAQNPNLLVLDTYYYTTGTLLQMSRDFDVLQWLSMAFVFTVLLVSFHFNLKHALLGFVPILLSWLIVLGAMVLFGIQFNLISIIISTFIFGIGVDYSIFVMNGLTAADSRQLNYHKTAIFFSAVTLVVTVSSMLIAQHPAIRSVGFPTLVGLLAAVVLSYVLQPAIYRLIRSSLT